MRARGMHGHGCSLMPRRGACRATIFAAQKPSTAPIFKILMGKGIACSFDIRARGGAPHRCRRVVRTRFSASRCSRLLTTRRPTQERRVMRRGNICTGKDMRGVPHDAISRAAAYERCQRAYAHARREEMAAARRPCRLLHPFCLPSTAVHADSVAPPQQNICRSSVRR